MEANEQATQIPSNEAEDTLVATTALPIMDEDDDIALANTGKEPMTRMLLRVMLSIAVIAAGTWLILFCVARAAQYDSIAAMCRHMASELALIWQRIIS